MYDLTATFPITKVDKANRTVTGIATADNIDPAGDLVEFEASKDAFGKWIGNIREMHAPKAVGKSINIVPTTVTDENGVTYDALEVTSYISLGAEDTWQKCLDGTLSSYSIMGPIKEASVEYNAATKKKYRRITKYDMNELSLVDNPGNPLARISLVKIDGGGDLELGEVVKGSSTVFYCDLDEIAVLDKATCSVCGNEMVDIGFVETGQFNELNVTKMIGDLHKSIGSDTDGSISLHLNKNDGMVSNMEFTTEEKAAGVSFFKKMMNFLGGVSDEEVGSNEIISDKEDTVSKTADETSEAASEQAAPVENEKFDALVKSIETLTEAFAKIAPKAEEEVKKDASDAIVSTSTPDGDKGGAFSSAELQDITGNVERIGSTLEGLLAKSATIEEGLATLRTEFDEFKSAGAIRKSAVNDEDEVAPVVKKSKASEEDNLWGNFIVPKEVMSDLGYTK